MAVERLSEAAHDVYDLSHAVVAAGFRDEVRTLGESSGLGGPLT